MISFQRILALASWPCLTDIRVLDTANLETAVTKINKMAAFEMGSFKSRRQKESSSVCFILLRRKL